MDNLLDLLKRIGSLQRAPRTIKGDYPAPTSPYKPILLLATLRRIQQGTQPYASNRIEFRQCLSDFTILYSRVFGGSNEMGTRAAQAFWYLGAGKPRLWEHVPRPGSEDELRAHMDQKVQIKSVRKLDNLVAFARFTPEHWSLLTDADVQQALISFLIAEQFTDVRRELERL